jgi:predicted dehydrogenase
MGKEKLTFSVIGCGFWAQYQIAAWKELPEAELVAVCDIDPEKAKSTAQKYGVAHAFTNAREMLRQIKPDFVDIITPVETHLDFVKLAADHQVPVICQKPLAPDISTAHEMVSYCHSAGVPLFVHENFRWQAPMRRIREILLAGTIGEVFKANVSFCSAFPVFENQPFLAEIEKFIIADVGSHVLDVARYLMGEVRNLRCLTRRVNPDIKGEDVANVLLEMQSGAHCYVEMSYASILEKEVFPQTLILLEGKRGSLRLGPDFQLSITTREGTKHEKVAPPIYEWVNPDYAVVQSSMVAINRDFLQALQQGQPAEITGEDNLRTMQLVNVAYDSAAQGAVLPIDPITLD